MSRLDDELRAAFRRVEPSSDFAERVIGRINNPPAAKLSLWRRLKSFLEPPVARWVAFGVATSLVVAIFAAQYTQFQEATPEHQAAPGIAEQKAPEEKTPEVRTDPIAPLPEKPGAPTVKQQTVEPQTLKQQQVKHRATSNRNLIARQRKERRHTLEAEQAKEQLLLALQIASTTLNEANKMVRGDD
jgi:hypothetical protein